MCAVPDCGPCGSATGALAGSSQAPVQAYWTRFSGDRASEPVLRRPPVSADTHRGLRTTALCAILPDEHVVLPASTQPPQSGNNVHALLPSSVGPGPGWSAVPVMFFRADRSDPARGAAFNRLISSESLSLSRSRHRMVVSERPSIWLWCSPMIRVRFPGVTVGASGTSSRLVRWHVVPVCPVAG